jgi:DNA repair protein RadA/Sms
VAALASSFRERPIQARTLFLGEVGLAGEVRAVSQPESRLAEAFRLGFTRAVLASGNARHAAAPAGMEIVPVESVAEALERIF